VYESDITRFIRALHARDPSLVEQQRRHRATWWDRPQDLETQRESDAAGVPAPSYAYFPRPKEK